MDYNRRRDAFRAWFAGPPFRGDRQKFMERTGYTKGRVTQLFDENEPFGERTANRITEACGLPRGYFDRAQVYSVEEDAPSFCRVEEPDPPHPRFEDARNVTDSEWALLQDYRIMPADEREKLQKTVHDEAERYRAYEREVWARIKSKGEANGN